MNARLLSGATLLFAAGFVLWLFAYHVVDSDFWWHVKAGEILWNTKQMIHTDPFAWTREGLQYLATHEWLSQILFWIVFSAFGAAGVIALRWICACAVGGILLGLDRKSIWPNALLVAGMMIVSRQGFAERPQMLSNVLFAAMIALGFALLKAINEGSDRRRNRSICMMLGLQILWVNLHGGEALLTLFVVGCVGMQALIDEPRKMPSFIPFFASAALGLLSAMLVSPNFLHTFTYLHLLLSDQTSVLLEEWNPHSWSHILPLLGPLWAIALASLIWTRKHVFAVGGILLGTLILSRTGSRHEVLAAIAAVACTIVQLKHNDIWQSWMAKLRSRAVVSLPLTAILMLLLVLLNLPYAHFLRMKNLNGAGIYGPASAAARYVKDNNLNGKIFNTYRIGGELLYHFYPERKIFLDGRNVDYGYDYLTEALAARYDKTAWEALEKKYAFDVAIIEYAPEGTAEFTHLNANPRWALVFVDDGIAVYRKKPTDGYALLTPQILLDGTDQNPQLLTDLRRAVDQDKRGIRALLMLGKLLRNSGNFSEAQTVAEEAQTRSPYRHEPYQILATIAEAQGKWTEAGALYEQVIDLAAPLGIQIRYDHLAEVFERAGDSEKAEKYRQLSP